MDKQVCISLLLVLVVVMYKCPSSQGYCFNNVEKCMEWGATYGGALHSGGCKSWCNDCGYWNGHCVNSPLDFCPRSYSWHCVCRDYVGTVKKSKRCP